MGGEVVGVYAFMRLHSPCDRRQTGPAWRYGPLQSLAPCQVHSRGSAPDWAECGYVMSALLMRTNKFIQFA